MLSLIKAKSYIAFWFGIWLILIICRWDYVFKLFKVSFNCCVFCIFLSCCSILIPFFKLIACISCCFWLRNCYFFSWIYIVDGNFAISNLSTCGRVNYKSYCLVASWFFAFCAIWIFTWNDIFKTIKGSCNCCVLIINCRSSRIIIPCSKIKACISLGCWRGDCYIFCWVYIEFINTFY